MPRDLILAIETSNPGAVSPEARDAEARNAEGGRLISNGPGVTLGRMHQGEIEVLSTQMLRARAGPFGGNDDDLMPAIARAFAEAKRASPGVDRADLARVAVSVGPGGYTGLRVACAVAKMIALGVGSRGAGSCVCVAVPSARVVLARVPTGLREGASRVAIALASKGHSAWVQVFEGERELELDGKGKGGLCTAENLRAWSGFTDAKGEGGVRALIADRHLPAPMREAAVALGWSIAEPIFDPVACAELGAGLDPIEPSLLMPMYPREPDAVTLWRARTPKVR